MKKRIHLFNKYLLSNFCVPGALFSVANKAVYKTKSQLSEMEFLRSSQISSADICSKGGRELDSLSGVLGSFKMAGRHKMQKREGNLIWKIRYSNHSYSLTTAEIQKPIKTIRTCRKVPSWYYLDLEKTKGLLFKCVILIYFFQVHRFCPNSASTTLSQPLLLMAHASFLSFFIHDVNIDSYLPFS